MILWILLLNAYFVNQKKVLVTQDCWFMCRMGMQSIHYMQCWYMQVGLHIQVTTTALCVLMVTHGMPLMTVGYLLHHLCAYGTDFSQFVCHNECQNSEIAPHTNCNCLVILIGLCWNLQVKPVSERSVLDQKAYILFYIRDLASRGSTGAQQSTLLSLFPACKQLLSDGAGETTDDVDTLTDECGDGGSQARKEGGYHVSHRYTRGELGEEPWDVIDSGKMRRKPICCSHLRAVGDSYEFVTCSS